MEDRVLDTCRSPFKLVSSRDFIWLKVPTAWVVASASWDSLSASDSAEIYANFKGLRLVFFAVPLLAWRFFWTRVIFLGATAGFGTALAAGLAATFWRVMAVFFLAL